MEPDIKMRLHTPAYLDMIYVDLTLFNVNILEHGQRLLPVLVMLYSCHSTTFDSSCEQNYEAILFKKVLKIVAFYYCILPY